MKSGCREVNDVLGFGGINSARDLGRRMFAETLLSFIYLFLTSSMNVTGWEDGYTVSDLKAALGTGFVIACLIQVSRIFQIV